MAGTGPKVLVTGAAGFIGSHYVRTMAAGGYPGFEDAAITVLDKLTYAGNLANLASVDGRYEFVHGDIADAPLLAGLLPGFDIVVNFAAETHVDRSIMGGLSTAAFLHTNVVGAQTLFEACLDAGVGRVLHVSTDEVYGSIEAPGSFVETDRLDPNSPYSAAKAGGDLLARAYAITHGLNITVTRCTNNYGPYHFPEKVIPLFVTNLLDGLPVPLYGDGLNVRDWLHVDDHCRGIQIALERGAAGEYYNIGGGTELANVDLTRMLLAATGRDDSFIEPVEDRKGHDRRYSIDGSKLAALGYTPQIPFADGLAATVRWYRDNEAWWRPLKARAALV
jgi:dTDP-glucose 4,6-dehydratase